MKNRSNNNQPRSKFSSLIIITIAALIFWFGFLLFYHFRVYETNQTYHLSDLFTQQDGLIDKKPIQVSLIEPTNNPPKEDLDEQQNKLMSNILKKNGVKNNEVKNKDFYPLNFINKTPEASDSIEKIQEVREGDDLLHIIFSTDCSFFQDWQSLLLFHSALKVKQRGRVTRIASGCTLEEQKLLVSLYEKVFPEYFDKKFFIHFTPNFKYDEATGQSYDFYNKPYGVFHWLRFAFPPVIDNEIIILLDPDMILLRPFTLEIEEKYRKNVYKREVKVPMFKEGLGVMDYSPYIKNSTQSNNLRGERDSIYQNNLADKFGVPYRYQRGIPVSQVYGLGAPWADPNAKHFDKVKLCDGNKNCLLPSESYGDKFFSVGPPYILEKQDFIRLCKKWTELVPKVYSGYPYLLAEMYAYSMAAASEDLPHVSVVNFMVSDIDSESEGWSEIDNLKDDSCSTDTGDLFFPELDLPSVLHYCQFYRIGDFGFHKRRFRKAIFNCEYPLFQEIPSDISKLTYKNRDGEKVPLNRRQSRRHTFMLCIIHRAINDMLIHYKKQMCSPDTINYDKKINLVAGEFLH